MLLLVFAGDVVEFTVFLGGVWDKNAKLWVESFFSKNLQSVSKVKLYGVV